MRKILAVLVVTATAILLAACVNNFKQNYRPFVDTATTPGLVLLTEGATPIVTKSDDVQQEVNRAQTNGYIVVGEAEFNGELQSVSNLIEQAKAVKATLVIYTNRYTDTETVTSTKYVPVDTTTRTSGRHGGRRYDETSTTSELVPVPEITQVRNFDQRAVFLVKARRR